MHRRLHFYTVDFPILPTTVAFMNHGKNHSGLRSISETQGLTFVFIFLIYEILQSLKESFVRDSHLDY